MNIFEVKEFLFMRTGLDGLVSRATDSFRTYLGTEKVDIGLNLLMTSVEEDGVDRYQDDHQNEFQVYRVTICILIQS